MQVQFLNPEGIYKAEKLAIEEMRKQFSSKWKAYASLELLDRVQGNQEIDVVLITHERIVVLELKEWNGRLESDGDHWLLNGNDMGRSPVRVTDRKRKMLYSKLRDRLPEVSTPYVDYRVILCGSGLRIRIHAQMQHR